MSEKNEKVENSDEFVKLYRALSAVQAAAIDYVRGDGKDKEGMKKRAAAVADSLQLMTKTEEMAKKVNSAPKMLFLSLNDCGNQCWDPITRDCIDC